MKPKFITDALGVPMNSNPPASLPPVVVQFYLQTCANLIDKERFGGDLEKAVDAAWAVTRHAFSHLGLNLPE